MSRAASGEAGPAWWAVGQRGRAARSVPAALPARAACRATRSPPPLPRPSRGRFLLMYVAGALVSTTASFFGSPNLSLGASGAIFGLGGALAVYFYRNR